MADMGTGGGAAAGVALGVWKMLGAVVVPVVTVGGLLWRIFYNLSGRLRAVEQDNGTERRVATVEQKVDQVERNYEILKREFATKDDMERSFDALTNRLDAFDKKVESLHTDLREIRATQIQGHHSWRGGAT